MITDLCLSTTDRPGLVSRPRTGAAPGRNPDANRVGAARRRGPPLRGVSVTAATDRACPLVVAPAPTVSNRYAPPTAEGIDGGGDFILRLYLRDLGRARPAGNLGSSPEHLVLDQLPRVVRIAFDYQGFGLPLGDLINEGNLGLMRAAELFDPSRNVRFSYYAKPWIRVQMQRALSYQASPVSLPADYSWRHGQVLGAEERLTVTLNRSPDDAELGQECGLQPCAVRRLRSTPTPSFVPLENPWPGTESGLTLEEVLPDETTPAPDGEAIRGSDREFIESLMIALTPAERTTIRLRFGLDDGEGRTLEAVGQSLGSGRQGAHRLEKSALAKLRARAQGLGVGWNGRSEGTPKVPSGQRWNAALSDMI